MDKEYIIKEDALRAVNDTVRYIDKLELCKGLSLDNIGVAKDVFSRVQRIPTHEGAEVTRCFQCKFYTGKGRSNRGEDSFCRLLQRQMQPRDFCSYAIRRDK